MGKIGKVVLLFIFASFFIYSFAGAEDKILPQPNIEYSADEIIKSGDMTLSSKVFYAPGKLRKEQSLEGTEQITIIRYDKEAIWLLMPQEHMYIEMPFGKGKTMQDDISRMRLPRFLVP